MMKARTFTEMAEICVRLSKGESRTSIQKRFGVGWTTCTKILGKMAEMGAAPPHVPRTPLDRDRREHLDDLVRTTTLSSTEISVRFGYRLKHVAKARLRHLDQLRAAGHPLPKCDCGLDRNHPRFCVARIAKNLEKRGIRSIVTLDQHKMRDLKERVLSGDTYAATANAFGIPESAVAKFKKSLDRDEQAARDAQKKIPQGRRRARKIARAVSRPQSTNPRADPLYDQISKAIPREIDPALRDDMISDTYMDVLEGRLALEDIQKGANASKRRVFSQYANRWGDISLDAPISPDTTMTLGDSIEDPDALAAFDQDDEGEY